MTFPPAASVVPDRTVAIVGIGTRFPGGLHGPDTFWQALLERRDATVEIPEQRWKTMVDQIAEEQRPQQPYRAGVVEDIDAFDHEFFGITATEAAEMDPQQRMLLETVVEALTDAGIAPGSLGGTATGVYVGAVCFDQATLAFTPGRRTTMSNLSGTALSILANRVSYFLDLRGPSLTIDTACSSSLTALHYARQALENGEIDTAIVGGVNILLNGAMMAAFHEGGVLGATGATRPFDADGDGYVRGEGAGVVVLRRHADAQAAGDRIYALVRSTAVNSDGRTHGMFAPSSQAQADMLRTACARAGVDPRDVDYIQAHGTGTAAGDRIEAKALSEVLGAGRDSDDPVLVGSVKANIGHLEGGAGVAGVITAALALHHGIIPGTIHHDRMRPNLVRFPIRVPTTAEPWPERARGRARLAGVSGFGFGGTNAHALLQGVEEVPAEPLPTFIPLSAHSETSLRATAARWAPVVASAEDLTAVASTAVHRRDHNGPLYGTRTRQHAAVLAATREEAAAALEALGEGRPHPALFGPGSAPARPPRRVWVFSGHGSQWAGMGRDLYARIPAFAAAVDEVRAVLGAGMDRAPWAPGDPVDDFVSAQHAIFTVQVALARTWESWGITPEAVIGHSLGEAAAAHIAGALSLEDAALLVRVRSELLNETEGTGGLLATDLDAEHARLILDGREGRLAVAVVNGPSSTVISGENEALDRLQAELDAAGAWTRRVDSGVPGHSPILDPLVPRMRTALAGLEPREGRIPFYSTLSATLAAGTDLDGDYWARQMRSTVQLYDTLTAVAGEKHSVFVEIAPRSVLAHAISATLEARGVPLDVVPAGLPERDETGELLAAVARLSTHGHIASGLVPSGLTPVALPAAAWDRGPGSEPHAAPTELGSLLAAANGPQERRAAIVEVLRVMVGEITRTDPADLPLDEELGFLGVTSVALIEIRNRLQQAHPSLIGLPVAIIHAEPTIDRISEEIERHLAAQAL
ncbi:type I polyketide synthase [Marinactinospora thermotolerans]|nr:type I polyketide synthase [Marinactinospora thermotolerans]